MNDLPTNDETQEDPSGNSVSTSDSQGQPASFQEIALGFNSNLQALSVFHDRIGAAAASHDEAVLKEFVDTFRALYPKELEKAETPVSDDRDETSEKPEAVYRPETSESHGAQAEHQKQRALVRAALSLAKSSPFQRGLLRTSVLVSLMIYLEALISDLIQSFYSRHPEALPSDERVLSLVDLRSLGSIEDAEAFLVAKEVDAVLRESLFFQTRYFEKRLKVNLAALEEYMLEVIEIDQRRNLYVHNRGVVNRQYLERVDETLVERFEPQIGKNLPIGDEYLPNALESVKVFGTILSQQCWRKWDKDDESGADSFLINTTFEALQEKNYALVERMARYAAAVPVRNEDAKRRICINWAIALRDSDRRNEIEEVLNHHDWSACGLQFQVALAAVRQEETKLYGLLPRALASEEVAKDNLTDWPLFAPFKEKEEFNQLTRSAPPNSDT